MYINSGYKTTSARKTVLSIMWGGREIGSAEYDDAKLADNGLYGIHPKPLNVKKIEERISTLDEKIDEYKNTLSKIETYVLDLKKAKVENNISKHNIEPMPIYNILKDYLLKRISLRVNRSNIQGILTEITPDYIKLIEDQYNIIVAPLTKIDFIKLPL